MRINRERLTEEFMMQAAISSPSRREGAMSRYLKNRFEQLGGQILEDASMDRTGSECGNMLVRIPGSRQGEPLLLAVHMDTVEPAEGVVPVLADGVIRSRGETVLGADDKAGIAEIIEALEVLRENSLGHPPLEVLITVCEEIGLVGAKHFDCSQLRSRRGIALDTAGVDVCIHRAPSANRFSIEITGKEAHAGMAPEKGVSAIEVAARAISGMRLGRIDAQTTANVGLIEGGQAINIIPRTVRLEAETRSHDLGKLAEQTDHMLECFERAAREMACDIDGEWFMPRVVSEVEEDYPLMHVPLDAGVLELLRSASAELGRTLDVRSAGGGSDANILNSHGVETVILGTGMQKVHTVEEQVAVDDMVHVSELLVAVLQRA